MRIVSIQIDNFRGIKHLGLEFDPRFTLLVGDNGSGKTSILSALSVALGIWHVSKIVSGAKQWRNIMDHEVHEVLGRDENGQRQFQPAGPVQITATGSIGDRSAHAWTRRKRARKSRTVDQWATQTVTDIQAALAAREQRQEALPLLAYYGAGRAWLPSNERELADLSGDLKSRPEDGYYDCLSERIRVKDVIKWFVLQAAKRDESGQFKPAFEAVRLALKRGIPGIDEIYWDHLKGEVVVSIHGKPQPFTNLSHGQMTMAATLADMAIRAVSLNSHLLGNGGGSAHPEQLLDQTPGVVLIDEVDVHLHPEWQRSVIKDFTGTFPKVQFICSSHSPQVFGELPKDQILVHSATTGDWHHPSRSFGVDSSRILDEEMDASSANPELLLKKSELAQIIDKEDFTQAEKMITELSQTVGENDPDLTRARTLISFLQDTK
ncbi:AAA family ATPase [Verrucomicrobium spinosum]|uniref:AAA family ATPase n=1 Tax=Verrucomicrobium spinosum TaxID=2736 RepID=UPI00017456AC|nr:AAA family ATPase [Verrucomicrobium spinosum]